MDNLRASESVRLHSPLISAFLSAIPLYLRADLAHRDTLQLERRKAIQELIVHLSIYNRYTSIFESFYLSLLTSFYTAESTQLASQPNKSAREFILHCDKRITQEMQRCEEVMQPSSAGPVRSKTEHSLLEGRLKWLAQDGAFVISTCPGLSCRIGR